MNPLPPQPSLSTENENLKAQNRRTADDYAEEALLWKNKFEEAEKQTVEAVAYSCEMKRLNTLERDARLRAEVALKEAQTQPQPPTQPLDTQAGLLTRDQTHEFWRGLKENEIASLREEVKIARDNALRFKRELDASDAACMALRNTVKRLELQADELRKNRDEEVAELRAERGALRFRVKELCGEPPDWANEKRNLITENTSLRLSNESMRKTIEQQNQQPAAAEQQTRRPSIDELLWRCREVGVDVIICTPGCHRVLDSDGAELKVSLDAVKKRVSALERNSGLTQSIRNAETT